MKKVNPNLNGNEFCQLFHKFEDSQNIKHGGKRISESISYPLVQDNLKKKKLISIITVVYNSKKDLEKTIESVKAQKSGNFEFIIIDGGSEDGTLDIVEKNESFIDYWISEKDNGIYDAMNKGCRLALGDGLIFLNAGDFFCGQCLDSNEEFPYIIPTKVLYKNGDIREAVLKNFKLGMPISHQAIVFKNNFKLYDLSYSLSSDYEYCLRNKVFDYQKVIDVQGYVLYDNSGISKTEYLKRDREAFQIIRKYFGAWYALIFMIKQLVKLPFRRFVNR